MGRKDKGLKVTVKGSDGKENDISGLFNGDAPVKPYIIVMAEITDKDLCNYDFAVLKGIGGNDKHRVTGANVVKEDMRDAFAELNVHLACIDDVFKNSGIEISHIADVKNDDLTFKYNVTGFEIRGAEGDESVILKGNKHVSSAGGRIKLTTPKIPMDHSSSYKWYDELKEAVQAARDEVAAYKEGKYEVAQLAAESLKQSKIPFEKTADQTNDDSSGQSAEEGFEMDDEFAKAKV